MRKIIGRSQEMDLGSDPNAAWNERQSRDPESRRLYEQERLLVWMTDELAGAIEASGLTRSEVAERLGTSKAHITQALRGERNLTLKSIADIAWATGFRMYTVREPLRDAPFISSPVCQVLQFRTNIATSDEGEDEGAAMECFAMMGNP